MNPNSESPIVKTMGGMLDTAIAAAKSGDIQRARTMLLRIVEQDQRNAQAWLWLSSVVDRFEDVEVCLENFLSIEPENGIVRERLIWLKKQGDGALCSLAESTPPQTLIRPAGPEFGVHLAPLVEPDLPLHSYHSRDLSPSELEQLIISDPGNAVARREWLISTGKINREEKSSLGTPFPGLASQPEILNVRRNFACPSCGGNMRFNPSILDLQCSYCGHIEEVDEESAQLADEVLDYALTTHQGHDWAHAKRMYRCQQCGAVTIFPPAQVSVTCPYCDSAVFAITAEDIRLKLPQAIIPMQMEANDVREKVGDWFGDGTFRPSDLARSVLENLSPLYIPIWLVSAALSFADPGGESLFERRDFIYTDWVVPGIRHPAARHIPALKPYRWDDLVEFKPEYLGRWPASTYEVSLSSAFQKACEEMRKETIRKLPRGITNEASFFCQSYKLVLFPIWICNYTYRGKPYHLVVNGQTGKVAGDKPLNWTRIMLVAACIFVILGFLGIWLERLLGMVWQEVNPLILSGIGFFGSASILFIPAIFMLVLLVIVAFRS